MEELNVTADRLNGHRKSKKIMDSASRNPFQKNVYESHVINLRMYMELLFHYQGHLSDLEECIVVLANEIEEYKIIQSIPCLGEKSQPRFSLKLVKSIGLIIRKNWLPSLE
ncbi:hypothetical protein SRABI133_01784 [Peribacillus simplex]|uniref:Uncharacterized protein n=1 Tax=Peribacillus simplex TaxID=1478 RepID=A0A9W4KZG7_9BACI|nr:hypothetical protein SRABI133_01784 [Peribacillus simplex]